MAIHSRVVLAGQVAAALLLAMLLGVAVLALALLAKAITVRRVVVLVQQAQAAEGLVAQQLRVAQRVVELHGLTELRMPVVVALLQNLVVLVGVARAQAPVLAEQVGLQLPLLDRVAVRGVTVEQAVRALAVL